MHEPEPSTATGEFYTFLFINNSITHPGGAYVSQIWKVRRATGMQLSWKGLVFTRLATAEGEKARELEEKNPSENTAPSAIVPSTSTPSSEEMDAGDTADALSPSSTTIADGPRNKDGTKRRTNGRVKATATAIGSSDGGTRSGSLPSSGSDGVLLQPSAGRAGGGGGAEQAVETMHYDRVAITYLSLLLLPLVLGFSAKKLVMDEHAGWYSWALQSLTVRRTSWYLTNV